MFDITPTFRLEWYCYKTDSTVYLLFSEGEHLEIQIQFCPQATCVYFHTDLSGLINNHLR